MRFRVLLTFFTIALLGVSWLAKHRDSGRSPASLDAPSQPAPAVTTEAPRTEPDACRNFYKTVCQKRGPSRDPTGVVDPDFEGELQALRVYQDIVRSQPDWNLDEVDEELVKRIYTDKAKEKITSAYQWVRMSIEKWIEEQPASVFSAQDKARVRARIRDTRLELPGPAKVYDDERELFTKNDVFYERVSDGRLRMRVGGAFLLNVRSWFNLVFTISHEFGHAIDPCEIRAAGMNFPAYDQLSACFLRTGLVLSRQERRECAQNDQLSETFADWLAVKITARALRQYARNFKPSQLVSAARNAVRDLCDFDEDDGRTDSEFHPAPAVRIERIFGDNPEIRELLGCSTAHARQIASDGKPSENYCDFKP